MPANINGEDVSADEGHACSRCRPIFDARHAAAGRTTTKVGRRFSLLPVMLRTALRTIGLDEAASPLFSNSELQVQLVVVAPFRSGGRFSTRVTAAAIPAALVLIALVTLAVQSPSMPLSSVVAYSSKVAAQQRHTSSCAVTCAHLLRHQFCVLKCESVNLPACHAQYS
jgi:hypothetical protein